MPKAFAHIGRHVNSDQQDRIIKVFRDEAVRTGNPQPIVNGDDLYHHVARYFGSMNELKGTMQMLLDAGVIMYMGEANKKKMYCLVKEPY